MYRFQNLSTAAQNFEKSRNVGEYKNALNQLSSVSLTIPDKARDYATVAYDTLDVMARELLCNLRRKQRFARFRTQKRAINHLASTISYDEEQETLRRTRGRAKRALKKELYARQRVVFFGKAQFGHGARGPVPRKALIRALALKCPVVLVNEYRTSKCCHGCDTVLQRGPGFRVFRCTNSQTGEDSCSVYHIDRDINAARNIGTCGVHMLLHKTLPEFLQRNNGTASIFYSTPVAGRFQYTAKAFSLCQRVAQMGDHMAKFNLGWCYARGIGTQVDEEKSKQLFAEAMKSEKGIAELLKTHSRLMKEGALESTFTIALAYEFGLGVERNLETALQLYNQASDKGSIRAKRRLEATSQPDKSQSANEAMSESESQTAGTPSGAVSQKADCGAEKKSLFAKLLSACLTSK